MFQLRVQIEAFVPATSANLGPGFDALGMALDLGLTVSCRSGERDDLVQHGEATGPIPLSANLLFKGIQAVYDRRGIRRPPLEIAVDSPIPVSRGMGSSAAATVAGLLIGSRLVGDLDEATLLEMATRQEGHPDNVAPAFLGGVTASVTSEGGRVEVVRVPVAPSVLALDLVVVIPEARLPTAAARKALPEHVSHKDATFNAGRAALLVAVLASGRLDALGVALQDRLHQPYRRGLVAGMMEAMAAGEAAGAHGVTISGAGPALLAWCPAGRGAAIGAAMVAAWGDKARWKMVKIAESGARAISG